MSRHPLRAVFLAAKITGLVMISMAGHKPDGSGFCDPMAPGGTRGALGDGCLDRIPNGPHALNDGGFPREAPGCGGK